MKNKSRNEKERKHCDAARGAIVCVNGKNVRAVDITYEQLCALYKQFVAQHGRLPITAECVSANNLPQPRIIKSVLGEAGSSYKQFLSEVSPDGTIGRARASLEDYDIYLKAFKKKFAETPGGLWSSDLTKNGLPNAKWLIKNCPDQSVRNYRDFCRWCGFEPTKKIYTKDEVATLLRDGQETIGRRLTNGDLGNNGPCHVSSIVVNRLFGGLNNAIEELGLIKDKPSQSLGFEHYRDKLSATLKKIEKITGRTTVSWRDVENDAYAPPGDMHTSHKTYQSAFRSAGVDIFEFMHRLGFKMNPSRFSYCDTFPDGERVRSAMEYDVSVYLKSLGLRYRQEYFRDVKYKTFMPSIMSNIDCDYVINVNGMMKYIEVAGMIYNVEDTTDNWRTHQYSSDRENEYRDKMVFKEHLLNKAGVPFLLLFNTDMSGDRYKAKISEFLFSEKKIEKTVA